MEKWDLFDRERRPLGRTQERGQPLEPGCYHLVVAVCVVDGRGHMLLTLRDKAKPVYPNCWENTGGAVLAGETSLEGALRELREETGAVPDILMPLGVILPSPGCYGEHLHLFLARELKMGQQQPDEEEFLRLERIPFQEMVHRIMNGEIEDAKTVAAVLKAKVLLDL